MGAKISGFVSRKALVIGSMKSGLSVIGPINKGDVKGLLIEFGGSGINPVHSAAGYSVPCGKIYPAVMNFGAGFL